MNIQIYNLLNKDFDKIKQIGNKLSVPSFLHYKKDNDYNILDNSLENIVHKFTCNKNSCCIDLKTYNNLLDNVKISEKNTISIHNNNINQSKNLSRKKKIKKQLSKKNKKQKRSI